MAACELKRNCETRYCEFYIDNSDEIKFLPTRKQSGSGDLAKSTPCSVGSIAKDMTGNQYILNGNDKWVVLITANSGGSSGFGDADIATNEEVNSMLDDTL